MGAKNLADATVEAFNHPNGPRPPVWDQPVLYTGLRADLIDPMASIGLPLAGGAEAIGEGRSGQVHPGLASPRRVRPVSGLGFDESSTYLLDSRAGHPWPAEPRINQRFPTAGEPVAA